MIIETNNLTLNEIADATGVSLSTVYRILRGNGSERSAKHRTVRELLSKAGHLKESGSGALPLLLVSPADISAHGLGLYNIIQELCHERELELIFTLSHTVDLELERREIGGILTLDELDPPPGIPCVYLNLRDSSGGHSSVCFERFSGYLQLMRWLKAHDKKRIGIFEEQPEMTRGRYFKHGLNNIPMLYAAAGLDFQPELVCSMAVSPLNHAEACRQCADYFRSLEQLPDAVILFDNIYAQRVIAAFAQAGIRVPEDLAVVTFGDSLCWPPVIGSQTAEALREEYASVNTLRTVAGRLPLHEMAKCGIDLLLEHIRDPHFIPRKIELDIRIEDHTTHP